MTKDRDFKQLVRQRMKETGESYTVARSHFRKIAEDAPRSLHDADPVRFEAARAAHQRLIAPYFEGSRLRSIPARRKPRAAVLLELLSWFRPQRIYSESEVNDLLREAHEDVAWLRRELVNYRYLKRDGRGAYWVCRQVPDRDAQEAQEVSDWERLWLPRFITGTTAGPGQRAE